MSSILFYLLGVIIAFIIALISSITCRYEHNCITVNDFIIVVIVSLFSWFGVCLGIMFFIIGALIYISDKYGNNELFKFKQK